MAKEQAAERARDETHGEGRLSGEDADTCIVFWEKEFPKHQRGGCATNKEVVPLER